MFYNQLNIPFFIVPVFGTIKKKIIALVQQAIWCLILTSQETEARPGCAAGRPAVQIGLMLWALWNTTHL